MQVVSFGVFRVREKGCLSCIYLGKSTNPSECPPKHSCTHVQVAAISNQDGTNVVEPADTHPALKPEFIHANTDSIAPELVHMKRELQGLSWVVKKPCSKGRTEESRISHQETIKSAASTGRGYTLLSGLFPLTHK